MKLHPGLDRRIQTARNHGRSLAANTRRRPLPLDEARVVLGTARSGTTWLMELIANDRASLPLFEPLHPIRTAAGSLTSISGYHVLDPDDHQPELERYLTDVLTGRVIDAWSVRDARLSQVLGGQRIIAKMIRLGGAAGWFNHHFPHVRTVGVVRHPCAMVASMRRAEGRWKSMPPDFLDRYVAEVLDTTPSTLIGSADPEDAVTRFAVLWAVDNFAMVRDTTQDGTQLVGFEELVTDAGLALSRVGAHLALPLDADQLDMDRASMTQGPQQAKPATDLGRWRDELTVAEIDTVIRVAHAVGLTSVSTDPVVDMDAHRRLQATIG